jgi:hypothetical protein
MKPCVICEVRQAPEGKRTCGNTLCQSAHLKVCQARLAASQEQAEAALCECGCHSGQCPLVPPHCGHGLCLRDSTSRTNGG